MNERPRRLLIPLPKTEWHFDGLISEMARWNLKDRQSLGLCLSNSYFSYSVFVCLKGSLCCQSKDKMSIPSLHWIGFKPQRTILQFQNRRRCLIPRWIYTKLKKRNHNRMGHCLAQLAGWAADVYGLNNHTVTSSFTHLPYITCSCSLYWKSNNISKSVVDKNHHSNSRCRRRWLFHALTLHT